MTPVGIVLTSMAEGQVVALLGIHRLVSLMGTIPRFTIIFLLLPRTKEPCCRPLRNWWTPVLVPPRTLIKVGLAVVKVLLTLVRSICRVLSPVLLNPL